MPPRSVILAEDETDLRLFPPLSSGWARQRVIFGIINLCTGHRLFLAREHHRGIDFQASLEYIHDRYRGWHVVLILDEDRSHTAGTSQQMAEYFRMQLL